MTHLHLPQRHQNVPHPADHASWQTRLADKVAGAFGTMTMFWILVAWQLGWMALATIGAPLLKADPYPFVFLLFLGNLVQLWALPILGTATNRGDERRAAKAETDHQALTYLATKLDDTHRLASALADNLGIDPATGETRLPRPRS